MNYVELRELRGKMTYFSESKVFGCFEKHPKVVSGALRGGFRAREVFGSFEKRTPGPGGGGGGGGGWKPFP